MSATNIGSGFSKSGGSPPTPDVAERTRLIRAATPNILEHLWEMQNRLCDLCEHPIQDLILAALEHSTPVSWFAKSSLPIEEAIQQANAPSNLRCAHGSCNSAKYNLTREEWYARGLNNRDVPRYLTDAELLEFQFRMGAGGRIGGQMSVTSGRIQALGRANVESGRLASISSKGGKISGKISGKIAVESGQFARMLELPQTKTARRANGRAVGRAAVENKTGIFAVGFDRGTGGRAGSRRTNHIRWHVKRKIVKIDCTLCNPVTQILEVQPLAA